MAFDTIIQLPLCKNEVLRVLSLFTAYVKTPKNIFRRSKIGYEYNARSFLKVYPFNVNRKNKLSYYVSSIFMIEKYVM